MINKSCSLRHNQTSNWELILTEIVYLTNDFWWQPFRAVDFCVLQCTTGLQCTTEDALKMMPNFEFVIINVITTPFQTKTLQTSKQTHTWHPPLSFCTLLLPL